MRTEQIAEAGVVGAGGAGFPTHVKLQGKADTVVINAAECEPLLHKDKELILHRTDQFTAGLAAAMHLTGAKQGIIGIKKKYEHVIAALSPKLSKTMHIRPLDDAYPAGDEFILVYETLGRVVPPGGIPLSVGCVVMNAETACNVAAAVQQTTPQAVVEKYLSVGGAVANPCSLRVPLGTSLADCLQAAGGAAIPDPAFVVGGVMMGTLETDLSKPVTKTTGGLIVLPQDHFIVQRKRWTWERTVKIGRAACDQCSFCTELCPRHLLGHPIEPHRAMRSLGFSPQRRADVPGTMFCCECGLCSYYSCPEGLDPRGVCAENKRRMMTAQRNSGQKSPAFDLPFRANYADQMMRNRKTPTSRLMTKIGLANFVNKAPLFDDLLPVRRVAIPLRQHIGAACIPVIQAGDAVRTGQVIAKRPVADGTPALGADIHASIDGIVKTITTETAVIEGSGK